MISKYFQLVKFSSVQEQQSFYHLITSIKYYTHKKSLNLYASWLNQHKDFLLVNTENLEKYFLNSNYLFYSFFTKHEICYCQTCHKILKFNSIDKRRLKRLFCSAKCSTNHSQTIQKHKQTCLEKYGQIFKPVSEQSKEKRKQTVLTKYGVDNIAKAEKIKQKLHDISVQKLNNQIYKAKTKQTYFLKYGNESPLATQAFKKILTYHDFVIPLFDFHDYNGRNKVYRWKCMKCGQIFQQNIYTTGYFADFTKALHSNTIPRCLKCYPFIESISKEEINLQNFCRQYFSNIRTNDRDLISPYELDIVIPEIKLAIEFNGCYWHSIQRKPFGYHLQKTEFCEVIGYRLIHIWQDEWLKNFNDIKHKLQNIFKQVNQQIDFEKLYDRSWFSLDKTKSFKIFVPQIISRLNFQVQNCGYFQYLK